MENHLNRISVLFAYYLFSALILFPGPGLTNEIANFPKQFRPNRLVLIRGDEALWNIAIKESSQVFISVEGDGSLTLTNRGIQEVSSEPTLESLRGKMVKLAGNISQRQMFWIVGVDGKRRLVPNYSTYQCLKGTGLEDPIPVSFKILEQLPNIENAWAVCGTNTLRPNEALQKGSYLQAGDYKLLLTDRDLMLTKNGNQIWANNERASQLILQTDGNLVAYNSEYKAVWASGTDGRTAGFLFLGDDGSLRLYDAEEKQVWIP